MELTRKITKTNTVLMAAIIFTAGGLATANTPVEAKIKGPKVKIISKCNTTDKSGRKDSVYVIRPVQKKGYKVRVSSKFYEKAIKPTNSLCSHLIDKATYMIKKGDVIRMDASSASIIQTHEKVSLYYCKYSKKKKKYVCKSKATKVKLMYVMPKGYGKYLPVFKVRR